MGNINLSVKDIGLFSKVSKMFEDINEVKDNSIKIDIERMKEDIIFQTFDIDFQLDLISFCEKFNNCRNDKSRMLMTCKLEDCPELLDLFEKYEVDENEEIRRKNLNYIYNN